MNNQMKEHRPLEFKHGVIVFAVVIASLVIVCAPLQLFLGLYGVAATELVFAVIAIASARILNADFKAAFPLAMPPVHSFFGGLVMYIGAYPLMLVVIETTDYLFPSKITEIADSFVAVGSSLPPFSTLIIMAVMPAVCEELLHRGLLLSCFKSLKREWLVVLVAGLAFGLFHLDPYRLLSTAMLGALFAYIALKTNSMLIGMLLHFMTNAVSVYAIFSLSDQSGALDTALLSSEMSATSVYTPLSLTSDWLINGAIALAALYFGRLLLLGKRPTIRAAYVTAAACLTCAAGLALRYLF